MAETVHLYLTANGKSIAGESSQLSLSRSGSIECLSFSHSISAHVSEMDGSSLGRRRMGPVTIRKRVDASSPLLIKALTENQVVKGIFKFFRPCPSGDGQTEQFYTVELIEGRIQAIDQNCSSIQQISGCNSAPLEEVSFSANNLIWTFIPNGISHQDSWSKNR